MGCLGPRFLVVLFFVCFFALFRTCICFSSILFCIGDRSLCLFLCLVFVCSCVVLCFFLFPCVVFCFGVFGLWFGWFVVCLFVDIGFR